MSTFAAAVHKVRSAPLGSNTSCFTDIVVRVTILYIDLSWFYFSENRDLIFSTPLSPHGTVTTTFKLVTFATSVGPQIKGYQFTYLPNPIVFDVTPRETILRYDTNFNYCA